MLILYKVNSKYNYTIYYNAGYMITLNRYCSVAESDSLRVHGLQHSRFPCPSQSPTVCANSRPLSQRCHPTISSSVASFSTWPVFPSIWVICNESAPPLRWPKYWSFSFSISPSNEYSGFSFRIDQSDLLAVQGTLKSSPAT